MFIIISIVLSLIHPAIAKPSKPIDQNMVKGIILPAGFEIFQFAGPELANDIYCMTISPDGEVIVSGRGYVKQLIDENGDGVADRAITLLDRTSDGAMGLLAEKETLYVVGQGGLRKYSWRNGEIGKDPRLLLTLKTGGEHHAHAVSRGPDGYLYVLCGNDTGITSKQLNAPGTALKTITAGCVLRISPDEQQIETLCDGFRNAYGFDWSLEGELYTYDSDNERCLGLPWYEGCRFYRIERAGHYGWRSPQKGQFWRLPPYHPNVVKPLLDLGRGSPTGVVCYRHEQFPALYRGAFFLLDWTFGLIHCVHLTEGAVTHRPFLQLNEGFGFAPTAAAIHPKTGDLYIATGGRGTRGSVYRIRHTAGYQIMNKTARLSPPRLSSTSKTFVAQHDHKHQNPTESLAALQAAATDQDRLGTLLQFMASLGEFGQPATNEAFKEGYQFRKDVLPSIDPALRRQALTHLRSLFPCSNRLLNKELARALACWQDDDLETIAKLLSLITTSSSPIDDTHYLFCLACCTGPRSPEHRRQLVQHVLSLDDKYTAQRLSRERNWGLRVTELMKCLIDRDPALPESIVQHPDLGKPGHLVLVQDTRISQAALAAIWLKKLSSEADYPWNAALVSVIAHGPREVIVPLARSHWNESTLQDVLLPILTQHPVEEDRSRFIQALRSSSSKTVITALLALSKLPGVVSESELLQSLQAWRFWNKQDAAIVNRLDAHLRHVTQTTTSRTLSEWEHFLGKQYPGLDAKLNTVDGIDLAAWEKRLKAVPWDQGQASQGEVTFRQRCASCHQGTSALGPDLAGIGKRFNQTDLLSAILQPSRDVPERYRSTIISTHSGTTHAGLIIYEAVDGIILQTAQEAIRIKGDDIATRRTSTQSLMPAGLIDSLSDQQIADLLAWLRK